MLSYVHAFHAGNSGDILKHIIFSLTIEHLCKKEKPFSVIDTHAASGRYSLTDERLLKTGEAESGIKKLLSGLKNHELQGCNSWTAIVKTYVKQNMYPGSPEIARCLMRKQDELILNELHPQVIEDLKRNIKLPSLIEKEDYPTISVHKRDSKEFITAAVPPKTKRGCVIIDPSYEDADDYSDTADMFCNAYRKWSTGTFLIWYPLIEHRASEIERMKKVIEAQVEINSTSEELKCCFFELKTKDPSEMTGLSNMYGSGMAVVNPPYGLKEKMSEVLPFLEKLLKN